MVDAEIGIEESVLVSSSWLLIKVGLYRIRLVRINCDPTPAVMLSPAVAVTITIQRDALCRKFASDWAPAGGR